MSLNNVASHAGAGSFFLILGMGLAGCVQTTERPDTVPLSDKEKESIRQAELTDPGSSSRIEDSGLLFVTLDRNLKTWNDAVAAKTAESVRLAQNLRSIITRTVYWNFDVILNELRSGSDNYTRVIAAGALGFSRTRPAPGRPDRSSEAIEALLGVLDQGNDTVTGNAVLSLGQIADPSIPLEPVVDLMLRHHDPEVRSNAAYAMARLVRPVDADEWLHSLVAALDDPEPKVRLHVTSALARLKRREAGSSLVRKLDDERALVQAGAARAIGNLGYPEFAFYLLDKLSSPFKVVREYAHKALCQLSGEDFGRENRDWEEWCLAHSEPGNSQEEAQGGAGRPTSEKG